MFNIGSRSSFVYDTATVDRDINGHATIFGNEHLSEHWTDCITRRSTY